MHDAPKRVAGRMPTTAWLAAALGPCLLAVGLSLAGPALVGVARPALADDAPMGQRAVEEGLTCQCGCGLTVATCNHLECGFAVPARQRIAQGLAAGEPGQQILDDFRKEYGEKVLSSPIATGFNLLAWIAPYLGIFLAGAIMIAFFRRKRAAAEPAPQPVAPVSQEDRERLAALQREIEDSRR